jgi:hypothetical protein
MKPTIFEMHLASSGLTVQERKVETVANLNKATLMGDSARDSFSFLMKSLWVHSKGKKTHRLRDLVQSKGCSICSNTDFCN